VTFASIVTSNSTLYALLAVAALLTVRALPLRTWLVREPADEPGVALGRGVGGDAERREGDVPFGAAAWRGGVLSPLVPLLAPVSIVVLLLVYVPGLGHEVNGATRWVRLPGGVSFQPSELAKWAMPAVLAWWGWRRAGAMRSFVHGLMPPLLLLGAVSAIIVKEDLGTGALVFGVGVVVLLAAGARVWHVAVMAPVGLAGVAAGILAEPYRMERITGFLRPWQDPAGANYHMIQSLAAVAGGEGSGRGLGFGLQKFGYLPEDRTDFLFAIICEELGLVGAAVVIALYGAILLSAAAIARRERHPLTTLLVLGVAATLGFQALMNLMVVTGLAPTKGIALPLLSAGGTGWILTASSLGVLVSLDRSAARVPGGRGAVSSDEGSDSSGCGSRWKSGRAEGATRADTPRRSPVVSRA
jgi:cell division protein FtsW